MRLAAAALITLIACAPRSPMRARGLTEAISTDQALRAALAPRRVALVVGVDRYVDPAFPDLQHATADARAIAQALGPGGGGFDEVILVDSADGVTRAGVFDGLRRLAARVGRDDELLVYFAGHGTREQTDGQVRRFLLPSDARPEDLVGTAIEVEALLSFVLDLPPLRKGVIVDACFDGGGRSVGPPGARGEAGALPVEDTLWARLGPGDVQVFATTPGRPALEDDTLGHGVYTWYLLEAMGWGMRRADRDGDGVLTLWEAHDHARGEVMRHTGAVQVPEAVLRTVGEADLVLKGSAEGRRQRDGALLYLYGQPSHPLHGGSVEVDGRTRGGFPGTVALTPGRHDLAFFDANGARVTEGWVQVDAGRTYRADWLAERVETSSGAVGARAVAVVLPGFERALGPGGGVEITVDGRVDRRGANGAWLGGRAGLAAAAGVEPDAGARPLAWLGFDAGAEGNVRSFRWRAAWGLTGWWAPPAPLGETGNPYATPATSGWAFFSTGPRAEIAWAVRPRLALHLGLATEGTALGVGPEGAPRFVGAVTGSLGVRAGW